jgi:hypothetical protein
VLLTPLEFGILNLLRIQNRDMTKDEIITAIKRRYNASSRQIASALLDTLMATNNFVSKKDTIKDDGDHNFESRYVITSAAHKRIFSEAAVGRRAGGDLHLSTMHFVMDVQMNLGRYCIADLGKKNSSQADVTIYSPKLVRNENGQDTYNPSEWSDEIIAVEVEATPGKHPEQIFVNWEKNAKNGRLVWFIVLNEQDKTICEKSLRHNGVDPKNYVIQVFDSNALTASADSSAVSTHQIHSLIYESLLLSGGQIAHNAILERLHQYDIKEITAALEDLQSKGKLFRIGNPNASLQNSDAKITWSLSNPDAAIESLLPEKRTERKKDPSTSMTGAPIVASVPDAVPVLSPINNLHVDKMRLEEQCIKDKYPIDPKTDEQNKSESNADNVVITDSGFAPVKMHDSCNPQIDYSKIIPANTVDIIPANTVDIIPANTVDIIPANTVDIIPANTVDIIPANTAHIKSETDDMFEQNTVEKSLPVDTQDCLTRGIEQGVEQHAEPSSNKDHIMTEWMLLAIWESHMDNDEQDEAEKISDEINRRGFVIRQRSGSYHLYKKQTQ